MTINLSPFEAHFGRKANTSLRNISTESTSFTLIFEPTLYTNLDLKTVCWDELILEKRWDDANRSMRIEGTQ